MHLVSRKNSPASKSPTPDAPAAGPRAGKSIRKSRRSAQSQVTPSDSADAGDGEPSAGERRAATAASEDRPQRKKPARSTAKGSAEGQSKEGSTTAKATTRRRKSSEPAQAAEGTRQSRRRGSKRRGSSAEDEGSRDEVSQPDTVPLKPDAELAPVGADHGFAVFDIRDELLRAIAAAGFENPTPVQAKAIPYALRGENVVGQAQTGTGKTAAFLIPAIERLERDTRDFPQSIILVPTRELAEQVFGEFERLGRSCGLTATVLVGGKPMRRQLDALRRMPEIIVGTPGRVLDHLRRGSLKLHNVNLVVLDEADRMLDIGFRPDIERILRSCPNQRQTLLLSATVPPEVLRLAERYMIDPVHLNLSPERVSVDSVLQKYFAVPHDRKLELLIQLLRRDQPRQAIVFCRTKRGADRVYRQLKKVFHDEMGCMHGDLQQRDRTRVLQQLRDDELRFLVATDVVGRGIDVSGISHIINFDIPFTSDDYVHRIGRTGRMGREGTAYTFVCPDEGPQLTEIEKRVNVLLDRDELDTFEAPEDDQPEAAPARPTAGLLSRSGRGPKKYRRGL